jgi:hypothetical protein
MKDIESLMASLHHEIKHHELECGAPNALGRLLTGSLVGLEQMKQELDTLKAFAADVDDYLNTNNLTSIGHGSILHQEAKDLRNG